MQPTRIVLIGAAVVAALLIVLPRVASAHSGEWAELSAAPLSTSQLIALIAACLLPAVVMVLRERRRSDSPFDD